MKRLALIIILTLATVTNVACAKKKSKPAPAAPVTPTGPYVPPGSGPGSGPGDDWSYGATVTLTPVNLAVFSQYTGRPMNEVEDLRLNVNFIKYGNAYGGTIGVRYEENGTTHEGYFTSGDTDKHNKYNIWFNSGSTTVFHAVLEDYFGGVVLVLDDVVDLGDGFGPEDKVGGSLWFKNFGLTYAPHPPTYCWFVSLGPYDCRPWPNGDGMSTTSSVNPRNGYKKLATFSGLSLEEAFNGELSF